MATPANKLVIIGGGSGYIGTHLTKTLTSKGYDVKIISRTNTKLLPSVITWDQVKSTGLPKCCAIIGLQGQNIMDFKRWTDAFKRDLWESHVNTTALLRQLVDDTHCTSTFVSTSAVGIYPSRAGQSYTENEAVESADRLGSIQPAYMRDANFLVNLCHAWEKAASPTTTTTNVKSHSVDTSIIRCGLVLGRDAGIIKSLYLPFSLGLGSRIASGKQWLSWIHVTDLVGIYIAAMEQGLKTRGRPSLNDSSSPTIYNGVAPVPCTNDEFVKALGSALHRPTLGPPIPPFILKALLGPVRASMLLEGQRVLPQATLEQLHHRYLYPDIRSACEAIVKKCVD